jgi:hypothetical protein
MIRVWVVVEKSTGDKLQWDIGHRVVAVGIDSISLASRYYLTQLASLYPISGYHCEL